MFEEFHDGHHGGHLGYWNGMILATLYLFNAHMPLIKVQSDLWFGRCCLKNFKMAFFGSHLGYRKGMILAILNLYVAPMPPIKFRLNLTYGLGGDVIYRISK